MAGKEYFSHLAHHGTGAQFRPEEEKKAIRFDEVAIAFMRQIQEKNTQEERKEADVKQEVIERVFLKHGLSEKKASVVAERAAETVYERERDQSRDAFLTKRAEVREAGISIYDLELARETIEKIPGNISSARAKAEIAETLKNSYGSKRELVSFREKVNKIYDYFVQKTQHNEVRRETIEAIYKKRIDALTEEEKEKRMQEVRKIRVDVVLEDQEKEQKTVRDNFSEKQQSIFQRFKKQWDERSRDIRLKVVKTIASATIATAIMFGFPEKTNYEKKGNAEPDLVKEKISQSEKKDILARNEEFRKLAEVREGDSAWGVVERQVKYIADNNPELLGLSEKEINNKKEKRERVAHEVIRLLTASGYIKPDSSIGVREGGSIAISISGGKLNIPTPDHRFSYVMRSK